MRQLQATELQEWLADTTREQPLVLDVREPWEHEVCNIAGSRLLPMQDIPARVQELPTDTDIVVLCHHGMRSLQVAQFLKQSGLERVSNLSGGIAAWAAQVDPDMSQY
ncbi:MAG: rhodanese-like domain-containing protein [Betaproteobacteria bacterium]